MYGPNDWIGKLFAGVILVMLTATLIWGFREYDERLKASSAKSEERYEYTINSIDTEDYNYHDLFVNESGQRIIVRTDNGVYKREFSNVNIITSEDGTNIAIVNGHGTLVALQLTPEIQTSIGITDINATTETTAELTVETQ